MITLPESRLREMLIEAAHIGGQMATDDLVCYHLKDACRRLGISYNTLQARIKEGKIKPVDGRITGAELRRYLKLSKAE